VPVTPVPAADDQAEGLDAHNVAAGALAEAVANQRRRPSGGASFSPWWPASGGVDLLRERLEGGSPDEAAVAREVALTPRCTSSPVAADGEVKCR
jgi:hypothetical protein